ncbi:HipA domain-containing protein [Pectinatus frisingensis]|uniref:HipA domain-containing protein n=1 Tax=Pectinatus frisingensis TaxID=865 RepID=UPI0018C7234F|nr:HipA domain-containing protein [Pectinatus frisingensis]
MKIILMDKEIPVIEVNINSLSGRVREITKIYNEEYLPLPVKYQTDKEYALESWIKSRSISTSRQDLSILLEAAKVETASALSLKNLGLNLSDQYWYKPKEADITWKQVNLFDNKFDTQSFSSSDDMISSYSPDMSSNGELRKFWTIKNNKRYLYKESTAPYYQQAYNEVFASKLLAELNIPHVTYKLDILKDKAYSVCETFIDHDTEYVPALYIRNACKKNNNENDYKHFLRCMKILKIPCKRESIDTMLAFDYLINNNDRHYGNFGFIRNSETLKFIGFAPLFDHGNSLWYKDITKNMKLKSQEAKPFRSLHENQIKLIEESTISVEDITEKNITEIAHDVFEKNSLIDNERIRRIIYNIDFRAQQLRKIMTNSFRR